MHKTLLNWPPSLVSGFIWNLDLFHSALHTWVLFYRLKHVMLSFPTQSPNTLFLQLRRNYSTIFCLRNPFNNWLFCRSRCLDQKPWSHHIFFSFSFTIHSKYQQGHVSPVSKILPESHHFPAPRTATLVQATIFHPDDCSSCLTGLYAYVLTLPSFWT